MIDNDPISIKLRDYFAVNKYNNYDSSNLSLNRRGYINLIFCEEFLKEIVLNKSVLVKIK